MLAKISEGLWVSSRPTAAMVAECGADVIVSCVRKGPDPSIVASMAHYSQYLIPDGKFIDREKFRAAVMDVECWLAEGHTVLVHCNAGRNRSCTVAALVLVRRGMPGYQALGHVRSCRPRAVGSNAVFEEWLMSGGNL